MKKQNYDVIGAKTIPNRSAQNTGLLPQILQELPDTTGLDKLLPVIKQYSEGVSVILRLQIEYGLRISEVLGIEFRDLVGGNRVIIRTLKGGQNRVIVSADLYVFARAAIRDSKLVFNGISRFYVYRCYNRFGVGSKMGVNIKRSVTHYPRYIAVQSIVSGSGSLMDAKGFMGHNSIKSTSIYNEKRKKG